MFNQPQVYIEASVRINAKEFERDFYTTLYEDMELLRAIWISCEKTNSEICTNDASRKDAVTMAASTLHMTVFFVGRSFILESLYKRMLEYIRHAWHEDEACYEAALQVCSDYEDGRLWYSEGLQAVAKLCIEAPVGPEHQYIAVQEEDGRVVAKTLIEGPEEAIPQACKEDGSTPN